MGKPVTQQHRAELDWLIGELLVAGVRSVLTFGVYSGGVEWHLGRAYDVAMLPLTIIGVDRAPRPELAAVQAEAAGWPGVSLHFLRCTLPGQFGNVQLGMFDAVFIDAAHDYASVAADFALALKHARRLVALHDIVDSEHHHAQGCEVARLWAEVKDRYPSRCKCVSEEWGGIGIVEVDGTPCNAS